MSKIIRVRVGVRRKRKKERKKERKRELHTYLTPIKFKAHKMSTWLRSIGTCTRGKLTWPN